MIKAVIFDLNGVFIQSPKLSERFEKQFKVPAQIFLPILNQILDQVRLPGAKNIFSYWQPYFLQWDLNLTEQEFLDFWFKAEQPMPEMIELAKQIRNRGIKIFILSNNFKERTEYYRDNFPFLNEIADKIYFSWETGFVKTSPEAYKLLLKENNLKPEDCIYFDDQPDKIKIAESLGIKSYLFKNIPDIIQKIKVS